MKFTKSLIIQVNSRNYCFTQGISGIPKILWAHFLRPVNHQLFVDDTQLQKSAPLSEVTSLTKELDACTDDIKTWMTENQLKLNGDKTEAPFFPFSSSLKPSTVSLPDSISLGSHNIPFSDSARNLGVILDSKLSMKKHVIKICQTAYFELKRISSIRSTTATVSSWVHLILSSNLTRKLKTLLQDLFSWHPATSTQHLSWKNCTGFPFQNIINYKVACMCFIDINGSGPAYLSELLHVYTPSRTLRSSSDTRVLKIQQHKGKNHGFRAFSCFGPHIWNSLPH